MGETTAIDPRVLALAAEMQARWQDWSKAERKAAVALMVALVDSISGGG